MNRSLPGQLRLPIPMATLHEGRRTMMLYISGEMSCYQMDTPCTSEYHIHIFWIGIHGTSVRKICKGQASVLDMKLYPAILPLVGKKIALTHNGETTQGNKATQHLLQPKSTIIRKNEKKKKKKKTLSNCRKRKLYSHIHDQI